MNVNNVLRLAGVDNIMDLTRRGESSTPTYDRPGYLDDERDLRRALEESKRLAEEEERNRRTGDSDLSKALQESEREAREKEVKERDQINRHNEAALLGGDNETPSDNNGFGAFPQQQNFDSSFSHSANPYLQQQNQQMPQQQQQWIGNQATGQLELADAFSNPVQSSQPMFPQVTGYQQSNPYQQQQQTSYNPYQQQQQEQFSSMQQPQVTGFGQQPTQQFDMDQQFTGMQQFQQPQQTGMSNNPFGQFGNQTSFGGNDQFQQAFAQQPQQTGFSQGFNSNNFTTTGSTPSFASQNLQPNVKLKPINI
jgi:epsin